MSTPRGLRNFNPGNIEHTTAYDWRGEVYPPEEIDGLVETRFCQFKDHVHGIRALAKILITYCRKRRAADGSAIDTVQEVIERWAPPSENDSDAYARYVRSVLEVNKGTIIDIDSLEVLAGLVRAITQYENGVMPYSDDTIQEGVVLALGGRLPRAEAEAVANLPSGTTIPVKGTIGAPLAWRDFLKRRPDLSSENVEPAVMKMTMARFLELAGAMTFGQRIRYRRDVYPDGRPRDHWQVAGSDGDCEDIALARRVYLEKRGWPRGCLRLTICAVKRPFQWHAVLQVETDRGTWVLDNLQAFYRRWTRVDHHWLWRELPRSKLWEKFRKG